MIDIDTILPAYVTVALWSETDDDGNPLDDAYGPDDLAPEALQSMRADLTGFLETIESEGIMWQDYMTGEQLAHDLWLTQNHHGAGFWDRGYPGTIGETLTRWAHSFGQVDLYVGDDGKIYC